MKTKRPLPKRFSGTIRVSGILIGLVAVLLSAASLAMAAPFAYVSSFGQDRVTVVDGANGNIVGTIGVGAMPQGVAVSPDGTRAYVANFGDGTVSIIDTTANPLPTQAPAISVCAAPACMPQGVAVNADGTRVYVANGDATIAVIDATTNTLLPPLVQATGNFGGVVVVGSRLFVADFGTGNVLAVDVNTGEIKPIPLGPSTLSPPMFGITADSGGTRVYVPYGKPNLDDEFDLEVAIIDPNGLNGPVILASVPVGSLGFNSGSSPAGIAVAGTRVYVAVSAENTVDVIDTAANNQVVRVPLSGTPHGVAVDKSGSRVFVGRSGVGRLSMIDPATNTVTGPAVPVGSSPLVFGAFVGTPQFTLTTGTSPSGAGTITPATGKYDKDTQVTVTATANTNYQFTGWSGACSGTGSCSVTMTSDKTVIANFALKQYTLTTVVSPSGAGAVTPASGSKFDHGTQVALTATANTGYQFTGWTGGGCSGTGACTLTMTGDTTVTATFALAQYTLTPAVSPSGAGAITPSVPTKYDYNTMVSVTAVANPGFQFTGWSGACTGTGPCNVTMTGDKSVTANFAPAQYTLTPAVSPSGTGTTTPLAPTKYDYNTTVIVTATPATGYQFTGWTGACTNVTGVCSVIMTGNRSVTANFAPVQYTLTPVVSPSGAGTTTPLAPTKYNYNTTVSVTAAAAPGYQFAGWSGGGCTGTGTCSVTMTGDKTVTASFTPVVVQQFTLTLTKDGTGTGTVGALPSSSNGTYNPGIEVSVKATPGANCKFTGWSGDCSGTGDCKVKMDAPRKVSATFALTAPSCDEKIADLQKKVSGDKHWKQYGHGIREALRLYAAAQQELARAKGKVGPNDKKYLSAVKELENGKAAFCAGRYWRAAHEFWEAYQIAHKILEHHRR
jgi:uncharacterized repeat protein (TIGR02543 family)